MKPRDLARLSVGDTLDLDGADSPLLAGAAISPLSLLSPNAGQGSSRGTLGLSPPRTVKPTAAAAAEAPAAAAAAAPPLPDEDDEENEPLGALPQLGGARRGNSRRPDPRRQSLAISQLFAGLSAGAGLLGDSELAVGDEDIQVPLAKSGQLLGGAANHSSLFCDPDTGDLLDTELPSPQLPGGSAGNAGGDALCDSPVLASAQRGPTSTRRTPALRASTAVFGDLTKACEGQGLDDFDSGDFHLQESNKVKELAFLFKMEGAAATPRTSVDSGKQEDSSLRGSSDGSLDSIRQRLQQYHVSNAQACPAPLQEEQEHQPEPALEAAGDPAPLAHAGAAAAAPAARGHEVPPSPAAQEPQQPQHSARTSHPGRASAAARGATAPPPAGPAGPRAAAAKPAASRLPAPPARASRLRPPTTSSGFFSHAATSSRQPPPPTAAAGAAAAAGRPVPTSNRSRASVRPGAAGSTTAAASSSSHSSPAPARTAAKPAERPAGSRPSQLSRLAHGNSSRIPTPSKPTAGMQEAGEPVQGGVFSQRTVSAAAARQRAPPPTHAAGALRQEGLAASKLGTPAGSAGVIARIPALRTSASPAAGSPATLTPNTARLRWLEQNPDLAFGGGTKLAASPANAAAGQPSKKLTAEERHMLEWQDHL